MRFDLSGCGAGLDESATDLLELGPLAERLGYDGLWINEEHFGQRSRVCLSPILLATALAMRTRTIRIGFSVLVLPLFEPIRLAEEIATLDVLSEGRVDLGVSRGNTSRYFEAWGLDYEDRSAAFDGVFDRLIRYWTEAKVEVGSRAESIEPKCVQQPYPPVFVATYREEAAAWVGQRGLILFQGSQQSVGSIRRCIRAFKDAGGDVAQVPIGRFVVVGESDRAARKGCPAGGGETDCRLSPQRRAGEAADFDRGGTRERTLAARSGDCRQPRHRRRAHRFPPPGIRFRQLHAGHRLSR